MKKLSAIFLSILFVGLCACGWTEPEVLSPSATNRAATETFVIPGADTKKPTVPKKVRIKTSKKDPYSYIVKERYEEILSHSIEYNRDYLKDNYYALYDIDGDGVELLLGKTWNANIHLITVYSIKNGVALQLEGFVNYLDDRWGVSSPPVLLKNGTIKMGAAQYYWLEDGEIKNIATIEEEGKYYKFVINELYPGTPISKAEFDRLQKEMEGDGEVVELDWKPLAEYGQ